MTWREIGMEMHTQHQRLWKKTWPPQSPEGVSDKNTFRAVDAAVNQFCETGNWPDLNAQERLEICQRLALARALCFMLDGPSARVRTWPIPPPTLDKIKMVAWLLTEATVFLDMLLHLSFSQDSPDALWN
jgi:hypothetical protein